MKQARLVVYFIGPTLAAVQPSAAGAQSAEQSAEQNAAAETSAQDSKTKNEKLEELKKRVAKQVVKTKELQSRIEQHQELTAEREAEKEKAEFAQYQEMSQLMVEIEEATMRGINIYGFFDFTFYKNIFDQHVGGFNLVVPGKSSFAVTGLNLYFQSQPIDDVKFLSEIKFSYNPDGYEREYEIENVPGAEYVQVDTIVRDPYTIEQFDQGGITIVRANLIYQPWDYFYIKVGRFITPYGIWNVDHGSPVVLPARLPYMQLQAFLPLAQTGLVIGGQAFPTDATIFNYALTLSNGRGPSDALFDADEHKALGLRLKGTWQHREAQISLGTYGYVGTRRDIKKVITIAGPTTDPEEKVPEDRIGIVQVKDDSRENSEYSVAADFQLDWHGLRLQAECAWRYEDYHLPKRMSPEYIIAKGGMPFVDQWYIPSNTGYDIYGLIAYTLPLQRLIGALRITPYYLYEHSAPLDTEKYETVDMHVGGINMAPWPELVLKLEITWVIPEEKQLFGDRLISLAAQMAVSF